MIRTLRIYSLNKFPTYHRAVLNFKSYFNSPSPSPRSQPLITTNLISFSMSLVSSFSCLFFWVFLILHIIISYSFYLSLTYFTYHNPLRSIHVVQMARFQFLWLNNIQLYIYVIYNIIIYNIIWYIILCVIYISQFLYPFTY